MTNQELEQIKQQLKQELLEEMKLQAPKRFKTVWDDVKPMIEEKTSFLATYDQYQLSSAMATILRHTFGCKYVKYLPKEYETQIKLLVSNLLRDIEKIHEQVTKEKLVEKS